MSFDNELSTYKINNYAWASISDPVKLSYLIEGKLVENKNFGVTQILLPLLRASFDAMNFGHLIYKNILAIVQIKQ